VTTDAQPSLAQEMLLLGEWIAAMRGEEVLPWVLPLRMRFSGAMDVGALGRALNEVVRRHEVLRTGFLLPRPAGFFKRAALVGVSLIRSQRVRRAIRARMMRSVVFRQRILPAVSLQLKQTDLSPRDPANRNVALNRLAIQDVRQPFDLAEPPLMRAHLVRLAEHEHILLLTTSHLVSDAWSIEVLRREVGALYDDFSNGRPSSLSPLRTQYADFAVWERDHYQGAVLEEALTWWRLRLPEFAPTDVSALPFATKPARPAGQSARTGRPLLEDTVALVRRYCVEQRVTIYMVMLAALSGLLARYTNRRHVAVMSPFANRTRPETQGTIGWFAQMHILGMSVESEWRLDELIDQAKAVVLGVYARQGTPFPSLLRALKSSRGLPRHVFHSTDLRLIYTQTVGAPAPGRGRSGGRAPAVLPVLDRPPSPDLVEGGLVFCVRDEPKRLHVEVYYAADRLTKDAVSACVEDLESLLQMMVVEPSARLSTFHPVRRSPVS
jgi:hypothetical protein